MASEKGYFAAEILKGITDGITRGLEVRQQRELRQQEFGMQQKRLDFEEQRIAKQDERMAAEEKRKALVDEAELMSKGFRVAPDGTLEQIPEEELPASAKELRKTASLKTKGIELENQKTMAEIAKINAMTEKEKKEAKANPAAKDFKDFQMNAASFARKAELAEDQLKQFYLSNPKIKPEDIKSGAINATMDIPLLGEIGVPEALKPQDVKKSNAIQEAFVSAILRKESGASIPTDELKKYKMQYFPQPGDGPDIIASKAEARTQAIENLKTQSAGAINLFPKVKAGSASGDPRLKSLQEALRVEKDPAKKQRIQMGIQKLQSGE